MLAVSVDLLDDYIEVTPYWDGHVLHVRASLRDLPDASERISSVMLHAMRWRPFSDSRFLGMSVEGRALMRSIAVGIDGVMKATRADPKVSDYWPHLWDQNTPDARYFVAVAAQSGHPLDGFQAEMM